MSSKVFAFLVATCDHPNMPSKIRYNWRPPQSIVSDLEVYLSEAESLSGWVVRAILPPPGRTVRLAEADKVPTDPPGRVMITFPSVEVREKVKGDAGRAGCSLNSYITRAVMMRMQLEDQFWGESELAH